MHSKRAFISNLTSQRAFVEWITNASKIGISILPNSHQGNNSILFRIDIFYFSYHRAFFLGLLRHIQSLSRRGCWQTSFEFSKLLLSLDPMNDPLSVLNFVDYLGLKANQYSYVLSLVNEWTLHKLQDWPNFAYSAAIAQFQLELRENNSVS